MKTVGHKNHGKYCVSEYRVRPGRDCPMSKASALGMTMDCLCLSYRWKQPVIPAVRRYPFVMPLKALRHTVENNRHTVENNRHAGFTPVPRGLRSKLLIKNKWNKYDENTSPRSGERRNRLMPWL
jgi:hypothetical protein